MGDYTKPPFKCQRCGEITWDYMCRYCGKCKQWLCDKCFSRKERICKICKKEIKE